jgi:tetratricopeptide (TPR) repeat protein
VIVLVLLSWRTIERNRDWADEYALWSVTLRDAPLSVRAHTNIGLVYLSRNELDRAIEHFEKSLAIPSKPELRTISRGRALQNLGVAYYRKKDYARALECYRKCLELDPQNYVSHINIGVVYNAQGENQKAVDTYKKALEIFPSSKEAMMNLAIGYTKLNDYDGAIAQYNKLIGLDRGTDFTARAHFNMGVIYYYYKKEYDQAAYHFEIARKMDPVKYSTEKWLGNPVNQERIETPPQKPHQR